MLQKTPLRVHCKCRAFWPSERHPPSVSPWPPRTSPEKRAIINLDEPPKKRNGHPSVICICPACRTSLRASSMYLWSSARGCVGGFYRAVATGDECTPCPAVLRTVLSYGRMGRPFLITWYNLEHTSAGGCFAAACYRKLRRSDSCTTRAHIQFTRQLMHSRKLGRIQGQNTGYIFSKWC